jgi:hypothetical protein
MSEWCLVFAVMAVHEYRTTLIHLLGVKLLASVDISTRAPWITQNEQHFVDSYIPHELDAQMEGH